MLLQVIFSYLFITEFIMRILRISFAVAVCCWFGVFADHHEDLDVEDLALLQKMDELDEMIKLVSRSARSAHDHNHNQHDHNAAGLEDITDDKEMIAVMERVDLDNPANVESVADVMRTLPGDVQLEFLMKRFMMTEDTEKSLDHHQVSSSPAKRSADPYGGAFSSFFSNSGSSSHYAGSSLSKFNF